MHAAHWSDPARAVLQTAGLLICRTSCCHQENLRPTKTSSSTSLYHSPDATTLGNTELLKETASKFAQTLLQKETLSLLSWMANKSALCLREKLYLYLFKLFAIQTYLRRYSRIEAANISAQKMCRKARDLKGIVSCYYPHKITAQLHCNHLFTNLYLGFRNERSMLFHTLVTFPLLKTQYKMFAIFFLFGSL